MTLRVVGAGLGRTGTKSLKLALEQLLGAPCYHMSEVFQHPEHIPHLARGSAWGAGRLPWRDMVDEMFRARFTQALTKRPHASPPTLHRVRSDLKVRDLPIPRSPRAARPVHRTARPDPAAG